MTNKKIVLAHCVKTGNKFCMEVRAGIGGRGYEAINFLGLSESEYAALGSEVECAGLRSAANLLACARCGSRTVSGCSCNRRGKVCVRSAKFDSQCLYCDQLTLDRPKRAFAKTGGIGKIQVTSPCFDDVGEVLKSMGVSFENFNGRFNCDILFINCGTWDDVDASALASFVRNGGCLYASDFAAELVDSAFPGMVTFQNDCSTGKCRLKADVVDQELRQIAGESIEVEFDLLGWRLVKSTRGKVLLKASHDQGREYGGKPIMVSFEYGKGTVFYTSFHNHAQASDKERMLLQLLVLKQIGSMSNQTVEQTGRLIGLNISSLREKFRKG